ncbi:MAG: SurA N-terminal domain-containing protein, partial [Candidatus Competibacteraceae bacterium]|nr:SurA N-terminal domain-containing protein [Candidatus Competibacteraceae bacterium]
MLQAIRDRATSWIAYIIVGLLIIPFAFFGVYSYVGDTGPLDVAQVGEITISQQEYQRAFQLQRQRLQQLLGERYDPDLMEEGQMRRQVLDGLIDNALLRQAVDNLGMRISDQHLSQTIRSMEAFQQNAAFSPELYERLIGLQGYSKTGFEARMREDLTVQQLRAGVQESALVTPSDVTRLARLINQQRQLAYLVLPQEDYLDQVQVEEAQVEDYYRDNQQRFMNPERVRLRYLELAVEDIARSLPAEEEELRRAYQERQAEFSRPERRSASHILFNLGEDADQEAVEQARQRMEELYRSIETAEISFDTALAQAEADQDLEGGELGVIDRGLLDPAFEDTLYGLAQVGDISQPVRTPFGFHIIRLDELEAGGVTPFEEVRDQLAQDLSRRRAENRFYDMADTLYSLTYENPDSLVPAAEQLGLTVQESDWLTRQGGEGIGAYPQVVEAAFNSTVLMEGFNSEPLEVEPNHVVVVRLAEHQESQPRSLDEARDEVVAALKAERAQEAMEKDAKAIQERLREGESLETLAEAFGARLEEPGLVGRSDGSLPAAVRQAAFALAPPREEQPATATALLPGGD